MSDRNTYHTVRLVVRRPYGYPQDEWVEEHSVFATDREDAIRLAMQATTHPDWVTKIEKEAT